MKTKLPELTQKVADKMLGELQEMWPNAQWIITTRSPGRSVVLNPRYAIACMSKEYAWVVIARFDGARYKIVSFESAIGLNIVVRSDGRKRPHRNDKTDLAFEGFDNKSPVEAMTRALDIAYDARTKINRAILTA
jgi:hypothetical protein